MKYIVAARPGKGKSGRAPYGARGLKYGHLGGLHPQAQSRPVWGAWIEICLYPLIVYLPACRAPYGARGLKSNEGQLFVAREAGRAPYGARGLKLEEEDEY